MRILPLIILLSLLQGCDTALAPSQSLEVAVKGLHGGALSDDGNHTVVGSIHHGGSFWRNASNERVYNWNHKQDELTTIVAADFDTDGAWALTANPFNIVLWDTRTGKGERFWSAPGEILDAELGPNANFAILGLSDHTAVIFHIKRGGILRTFEHGNRVRSVDLSADGNLALTGSEDYTAVLWDVNSGEKLSTLKHNDDVQLVKLSADGSKALSVSKYDKAILWDTKTGTALGEIPLGDEKVKRGLHFTSARFNQDATLLITGRPDQVVQLWDTSTFDQIARWKLPKRDAWKPTSASVIDLAFSEDGQTYYALASNGFLHQLAQ